MSIRTQRGIIRRDEEGTNPARTEDIATTIRIGSGHDSHRLAPGGPLTLGGVIIPHDRHAVGHSDADALLHAVTDALLGAAGLEDIGRMFPDTDAANRGRDSAEMLAAAYERVSHAGWRLVNLDTTVFAEEPKLGPHRDAIRRRIAEILAVSPDRVNVKAKTAEGLGPIGRQDAIAAECVALLKDARLFDDPA